MNKLTKQEQKKEAYKACEAITVPAWEAYKAIQVPALKAYEAKLKAIDAQPNEPEETITHNGRKYRLIKE